MSKKDSPKQLAPAADDDWESEDHFRTLMRAHEIQNDPEKFKKAMKHASKEEKKIRSIQDLKKLHQEKFGQNAQSVLKKKPVQGDGSDTGT
jgi:hypothetical protein